jgi:hypothetical protein
MLQAIIAFIWEIIKTIWNGIVWIWQHIIWKAIHFIFAQLYKVWQVFYDIFQRIKDALRKALDFAESIYQKVIDFVKTVRDKIYTFVENRLKELGLDIDLVKSWVKSKLDEYYYQIIAKIKEEWDKWVEPFLEPIRQRLYELERYDSMLLSKIDNIFKKVLEIDQKIGSVVEGVMILKNYAILDSIHETKQTTEHFWRSFSAPPMPKHVIEGLVTGFSPQEEEVYYADTKGAKIKWEKFEFRKGGNYLLLDKHGQYVSELMEDAFWDPLKEIDWFDLVDIENWLEEFIKFLAKPSKTEIPKIGDIKSLLNLKKAAKGILYAFLKFFELKLELIITFCNSQIAELGLIPPKYSISEILYPD